ncbi:MAG: hypothetical protein F6K56_16185 [Moorea sp. SIO3G5]|nr:hypothetical protein [Moorena sp. SIO3G5]
MTLHLAPAKPFQSCQSKARVVHFPFSAKPSRVFLGGAKKAALIGCVPYGVWSWLGAIESFPEMEPLMKN